MLEVNGKSISIIRGDSEPIEIELLDQEVEDGTEVIFIVRDCETEYIRKELTVGGNMIQVWLKHEDTADMGYGRYKWGICFPHYRGVGEPYHVDTPWEFRILKGV